MNEGKSAAEQLTPRKAIGSFLGTILISTVIAFLITLLTSYRYIMVNLVMSYSFGISISLLALLLQRAYQPRQPSHLALVYLVALCGGLFSGILIGPLILRHALSIDLFWPAHYLEIIIVAIIVSAAATYFFYAIARIRMDKQKIEEEKMRRLHLEREALEAHIRMLQAQIEPHFLFNTLSNVVSLIDTDPAKGKTMLLDLTSYLRTSLSRTMPEKTTLAQEADMLKSYLNIQKVRMGERLGFTIAIPDALREYPFPPMLLQPLVENAVKHGLEPKIDGGEIFIGASLDNRVLRVEVADTGGGFTSFDQGGVGIANVRERLRLLFPDRGRLSIEENGPQGVRAVIEVPVHG